MFGNLGFPDSDSNLPYPRAVFGGITASKRDYNAHSMNESDIWSVTASLGPRILSAFWSRADASFISAALLLAGTQAKQSLLCTWMTTTKPPGVQLCGEPTWLVLNTERALKGCLVVVLGPGKKATECFGSCGHCQHGIYTCGNARQNSDYVTVFKVMSVAILGRHLH